MDGIEVGESLSIFAVQPGFIRSPVLVAWSWWFRVFESPMDVSPPRRGLALGARGIINSIFVCQSL